MHTLSSARRLLLCLPLSLTLVACGEAENTSASGFGSFSASNPTTQPSQASADPSATGEPSTGGSTGDPGSTGEISGVTEEPGTASTNPDPSATNPDPSTTNPDPSTTNPDPSTTNPDPSTTTGVDPSTTTGDPPDPPMKDPQPVDGLYEACLGDTCNLNLTDGCFTITDSMTMQIIDGYCTIVCNNVADCGPAPKAPAVQECLLINLNPMQKVCALKCNGVADCPTGMACTGLALPNNVMGSYCT